MGQSVSEWMNPMVCLHDPLSNPEPQAGGFIRWDRFQFPDIFLQGDFAYVFFLFAESTGFLVVQGRGPRIHRQNHCIRAPIFGLRLSTVSIPKP